MEATNTNIAAAEQTNAAFREAVERRAALRAAVEAEPVLLRPCAHCEEPISLMRVFAPYRDDLCDDCDSAEQERMSQDYEAERAADAPYHGRR